MDSKLIIVLCCIFGATFALEYDYVPELELQAEPLEAYEPIPAYWPVQSERVKRQLQLQGGGGGSPRQGFDLSIDGRAPVWKSDNGRHQVDVNGGYSQHLGGPYGNSPVQWRAGAGYTFRF